jgi:hypothetical protein
MQSDAWLLDFFAVLRLVGHPLFELDERPWCDGVHDGHFTVAGNNDMFKLGRTRQHRCADGLHGSGVLVVC